jgi:hypothetical protein
VGASDTCGQLSRIADEVVCAAMPEPFFGVGRWYVNFDQTSDDEVRGILERATGRAAAGAKSPASPAKGDGRSGASGDVGGTLGGTVAA